jgi:toxin ParE1/3/4
MPNLVVRPRALTDLAEIWAYIAEDSPERADAFADLLTTKLEALARRPRMGRLRPELAEDIRSFTVGRYVIFYGAISRRVEVVRVLHGSRDIEAIFEEEP